MCGGGGGSGHGNSKNKIKTPRTKFNEYFADLPTDSSNLNHQFKVKDFGRISNWRRRRRWFNFIKGGHFDTL